MDPVLDTIFGWIIERVAADPKAAVYLIAAWGLARAVLSFLDNYFDGAPDGWPKKILVSIVRVLNRWATAQGAARGLAGKVNKTSRTARRDDGRPEFNWH